MQVAIIGAGIGGLTLAIALKKAGISFVVYEATAQIKPVGAGIAIANNAMQVYRHLGISSQLTNAGVRISTVMLTDMQLQVLDQTSLARFEQKYQLANIAIHRSVLHRILVEAVGEEHLRLNKRLQNITRGDDGRYELRFTDDTVAHHEFVFGADGLRSQVRELLFGNHTLRDAHQVCWRGVVPFKMPAEYEHVAVESWGKGKRLGFVKLADGQLYWYFLIDEDLYCEHTTLANYLEDCPTWVKQMILQTPPQLIHRDKLYDLTPFDTWQKEKACLIGDAAHATTPNLGQGACQAIEDVYVISKLLEHYSLEEALQRYPAIRKKKAHAIVRDSWALGKIAQWRNPLLVVLRNTAFRLLPPWMKKRQMEKMFELDRV
ncbi:FAD-dependent monooxygenase [Myroides fluvii]|uniref:FAD-dependent monooxygenase n=1 Tax=Myroides fluvii TaxID=2572594 RepID=UPI00131D1E8C|nr:FAD-dependent monooxygenase [Myroides fluvii]